MDEWDLKLFRAVSQPVVGPVEESDSVERELRHLALLNEKIERYLERRDLLPSEIRDIAQAKLAMINCMEILTGHVCCEHMDEASDDVVSF